MTNMSNIEKPTLSLLVKLGSLAVHIDEYLSSDGHHFDLDAIKSVMSDAEVTAWLAEMDKLALLPKKRR